MRKLFTLILLLVIGLVGEAQPAYYNHAATSGGTTNVFPFNTNPGSGKRVQWVIAAGGFGLSCHSIAHGLSVFPAVARADVDAIRLVPTNRLVTAETTRRRSAAHVVAAVNQRADGFVGDAALELDAPAVDHPIARRFR